MHPWTRVENPQVFKRGGQVLLRLGDTDVPYNDEFRFFVTTKLANPHYMPEICIKVATRDMMDSWYHFIGHTSTNIPQLRYVEQTVLPRCVSLCFFVSLPCSVVYICVVYHKKTL